MVKFFMPMPEDRLTTKPKYRPDVNYLVVESSPKMSLEIFRDNVNHGVPGLWLTTMDPKSVGARFGLNKTAILSLTNELLPGEATLPPNRLDRAGDIVTNYLSRTSHAVVMLEGLSGLVEANGPEKTLEFLKKLGDTCSKNDSGLIVVADPKSLGPHLNAMAAELKGWQLLGFDSG
jgi:hypothetical protein